MPISRRPASFGYRTSFFLERTASLRAVETLSVLIDGVDLPPLDRRGAFAWRDDPLLHALRFEPLSTPAPGTRLVTR